MRRFQFSRVCGLILGALACFNTSYAAPTPTPTLPQVTVVSATTREGNSGQTTLTMRVGLSKASSQPLPVTIATQDGTAKAREDYLPFKTTITFSPGSLIKTFPVVVLGDTKVEPNEVFSFSVQAPGYVARQPVATCTIINDDSSPTPSPTVKPTATSTPRPTATAKPTATPTPKPTFTPHPTATATPRPTATPQPTATPSPRPTNTPAPTASIRMVAYADTWADARERWWDMGAIRDGNAERFNQFNDWLDDNESNGRFDYATRSANVVLTYERNPKVPYFVGHISAKGLKPNFVYQLKLAGKPVGGPRGTGTAQSYISVGNRQVDSQPQIHVVKDANGQAIPVNGDDWTNQQLGYAGRWWNDSNASGNTNAITDSVYRNNTQDTIYGYQFIGDFVTDARGNAEADISGARSYHITWADWQGGIKDVFFGSFSIQGFLDVSDPPHYYGYGNSPPASGDAVQGQNGLSKVGLWYELQSGRPDSVALARGTYHCRLLITEETFHNLYGATNNILGGKWKTVMGTEDRDPVSGEPDSNPNNDIMFSIP